MLLSKNKQFSSQFNVYYCLHNNFLRKNRYILILTIRMSCECFLIKISRFSDYKCWDINVWTQNYKLSRFWDFLHCWSRISLYFDEFFFLITCYKVIENNKKKEQEKKVERFKKVCNFTHIYRVPTGVTSWINTLFQSK